MAKLKDFFNKVSNNNRIFTAEDIGEMSGDEFSQNEKAIDYQTSTLGIPQRSDLNGNSDVVYVHSYTRSDGTEVKAHYRSKHGGTFTGAATGITEQPMLTGGVSYNDYLTPKNATITEQRQYQNNRKIGFRNKQILEKSINSLGPRLHQDDAVNFWNIATDDIGIYNNNFVKNGTIYNDVESLNSEFTPYKTKIQEKVNSQFGNVNVPGIVFHEKSSVANAISISPELKDFVYHNITDLKAGKNVSGSLRFDGFTNLHNAFGRVDVLSAKSKGNYIEVTILDTYDFNKNSKNFFVNMARKSQETGFLNPYFTIVKCRYKLK